MSLPDSELLPDELEPEPEELEPELLLLCFFDERPLCVDLLEPLLELPDEPVLGSPLVSLRGPMSVLLPLEPVPFIVPLGLPVAPLP